MYLICAISDNIYKSTQEQKNPTDLSVLEKQTNSTDLSAPEQKNQIELTPSNKILDSTPKINKIKKNQTTQNKQSDEQQNKHAASQQLEPKKITKPTMWTKHKGKLIFGAIIITIYAGVIIIDHFFVKPKHEQQQKEWQINANLANQAIEQERLKKEERKRQEEVRSAEEKRQADEKTKLWTEQNRQATIQLKEREDLWRNMSHMYILNDYEEFDNANKFIPPQVLLDKLLTDDIMQSINKLSMEKTKLTQQKQELEKAINQLNHDLATETQKTQKEKEILENQLKNKEEELAKIYVNIQFNTLCVECDEIKKQIKQLIAKEDSIKQEINKLIEEEVGIHHNIRKLDREINQLQSIKEQSKLEAEIQESINRITDLESKSTQSDTAAAIKETELVAMRKLLQEQELEYINFVNNQITTINNVLLDDVVFNRITDIANRYDFAATSNDIYYSILLKCCISEAQIDILFRHINKCLTVSQRQQLIQNWLNMSRWQALILCKYLAKYIQKTDNNATTIEITRNNSANFTIVSHEYTWLEFIFANTNKKRKSKIILKHNQTIPIEVAIYIMIFLLNISHKDEHIEGQIPNFKILIYDLFISQNTPEDDIFKFIQLFKITLNNI